MHRKKAIAAILGVALLILACDLTINLPTRREQTMPLVTEEIRIPPPENVEAVADVDLGFFGGTFLLNPGSSDALISGTISYNIDALKPSVRIEDTRVKITQEDDLGNLIPRLGDDIENNWDLKIGPFPMDLRISAGGYKSEMELGGLSLRSLRISEGAADTSLSFSSPNLVEMENLRYDTGASKSVITGLSNANFSRMNLSSGAGDYTLDFTGVLQRDATVVIKTGLSNIEIIVPEGIAAQVMVTGGLSNVNVHDAWEVSGNVYTNSGEGPRLVISVEMGAGNLELRN